LRHLLATLAVGVLPVTALALDVNLGNAAAYSAFIFEDIVSLTSVEGRLAVGGNLSVTQAAIGSGTPQLSNTPALVVRGNISSFSGGALWSGTAAGYGLYLGTKAASVPASLDLRKVASLPVDFDTERIYLGVMSEQWRDAPVTGRVTRGNGVLQLTGTGAAVEVFALAAADVSTAQPLTLTNIRADAHIVVNVAADASRRLSFAIDTAALQAWKGRVLFNAHDAETVKFNDLTVWGSLLAPNACICTSTGRLEGSVVARKWSATMHITYTPFVPRP
jgi:choice-of-anchor A domain-containing protein